MKRITPSEMTKLDLVRVGEFGFGTRSTSGEIVCPRVKKTAVAAAYEAIKDGDSSSGVLDDVIAAGGEHVIIEY